MTGGYLQVVEAIKALPGGAVDLRSSSYKEQSIMNIALESIPAKLPIMKGGRQNLGV